MFFLFCGQGLHGYKTISLQNNVRISMLYLVIVISNILYPNPDCATHLENNLITRILKIKKLPRYKC